MLDKKRQLWSFSLLKKINKKAMDPGQIFIYAISLFVVAFILIFGYMVINDFIGSSSDVEMLQFQKEMERYVESYSSDYGSRGYKSVSMPSDIYEICFTEYYDMNTYITGCDGTDLVYPVIKDAYGGGDVPREKKNFFLINSKEQVVKSYYLGNITVSDKEKTCNYLCIKNYKGKFNFRIRGDGLSADISSE